jgi:membrane protein YdbS with pleckstrin-like domain
MEAEKQVWSGRSSQIVNLGTFIVCGLICLTVIGAIVALPYAIWKYLLVRTQTYEVTSQRIRVHSGVLSKKTEEMELYRVKDTKFDQPFFLRLFGLGNVVIVSNDATTPISIIPAIKGAGDLREQLRNLVEDRRDQKRVRVAEFE